MTSARAVHAATSGVLSQPKTAATPDAERCSKRRIGPSARKCPVCGSSLDGRKATAQFCSGKCRAAASRMSKAQDFEGLLRRMAKAEQALHQAADELGEYRIAIEVRIGRAIQ